MQLTGEIQHCVNLGSYNYFGFAAYDAYCTPRVLESLKQWGWGSCSPRSHTGTLGIHCELEEMVADYVGVESAITYGMGFATNSFVIPALVGKGCLVLSDALNHSSIVTGVRGSGAKVQVFKHNDVDHLEAMLKAGISEGQPRTHRPWKKVAPTQKVLIIVEGIYSMEGEICNLKEIVALKKKYKAYLFLDEAHSIGALGKTGRGICEHAGVNPQEVDIMMGTFTKSFGASGGYIGGSKRLIDYLRKRCPNEHFAASMSPVIAEQVLSAFKLLRGEDGTGRGIEKVHALRRNANYFREKLMGMGLHTLGDWDSPVIPVMLYLPGKLALFSRECLERHLAMVVVGFPATTLASARARVCISASHTLEDLDFALEAMEEVADIVGIRFSRLWISDKTTPARSLDKTPHVVMT